jgi:hypothetical protein
VAFFNYIPQDFSLFGFELSPFSFELDINDPLFMDDPSKIRVI